MGSYADGATRGFKALKQAIKLEFRGKKHDKVIEHYAELLTYIKSAVTRNYSEKSINNLLDLISSSNDPDDMACMEKIYDMTLKAFEGQNNERLWLKTNLKLAKLWLELKEYGKLTKILRLLHQACQKPNGEDDPSKGTYLMEVFAIEIQMFSETGNNKKLKALYNKSLRVRSAVPHPRIMGIIRECGGKMHMNESNWKEAQSDFFESFRNYDEAGSLQRIQVLKYLVLASMLMKSEINPFDSQETKPYVSPSSSNPSSTDPFVDIATIPASFPWSSSLKLTSETKFTATRKSLRKTKRIFSPIPSSVSI